MSTTTFGIAFGIVLSVDECFELFQLVKLRGVEEVVCIQLTEGISLMSQPSNVLEMESWEEGNLESLLKISIAKTHLKVQFMLKVQCFEDVGLHDGWSQ